MSLLRPPPAVEAGAKPSTLGEPLAGWIRSPDIYLASERSSAPHLAHAAGAAFALRDTARVVVAHFTESAVGQPDFHNGLNFSAVWQVPVVFVGPGSPAFADARGAAYGLTTQSTPEATLASELAAAIERARRGRPQLLVVHG